MYSTVKIPLPVTLVPSIIDKNLDNILQMSVTDNDKYVKINEVAHYIHIVCAFMSNYENINYNECDIHQHSDIEFESYTPLSKSYKDPLHEIENSKYNSTTFDSLMKFINANKHTNISYDALKDLLHDFVLNIPIYDYEDGVILMYEMNDLRIMYNYLLDCEFYLNAINEAFTFTGSFTNSILYQYIVSVKALIKIYKFLFIHEDELCIRVIEEECDDEELMFDVDHNIHREENVIDFNADTIHTYKDIVYWNNNDSCMISINSENDLNSVGDVYVINANDKLVPIEIYLRNRGITKI